MRRGLKFSEPEVEAAAVQVVRKMAHVANAKVDVYRLNAV
jgi:hypothetical protein